MKYEKKYKDLIARINEAKEKPSLCMKEKHHYNGYVETGIRDALDYIINPESEDERIRTRLIALVEAFGQGKYKDEMLAYLERQKEQKPEWKPLEESMEALLLAIEGKWDAIKPTGYMSRRLEDLYDGLVNTFNIRETYLPKTNYTEKDIEELKTLKSKIDVSMEQKPAEWSEDGYVRVYEPRPGTIIDKAISDAIEEARKIGECLILRFNGVCLSIKKNSNPDTLKSMYYWRWKPSEAQIEALKDAVAWISKEQDSLESLYNDLKKLI